MNSSMLHFVNGEFIRLIKASRTSWKNVSSFPRKLLIISIVFPVDNKISYESIRRLLSALLVLCAFNISTQLILFRKRGSDVSPFF